MRIDNEKEITESGKALALTVVLTNILLILMAGGIFWLVQILLSQPSRLEFLVRDFTLS